MCKAFIHLVMHFLDLTLGSVQEAEMKVPAFEEFLGYCATFHTIL